MLGARRLQVTSVEDFSTNYCNLRNLYCELVVAKAPLLTSLLSACLLPCHVSAFILAYRYYFLDAQQPYPSPSAHE